MGFPPAIAESLLVDHVGMTRVFDFLHPLEDEILEEMLERAASAFVAVPSESPTAGRSLWFWFYVVYQ